MFTIGRSRTTGHNGVITWNAIHHKTRMDGGPVRYTHSKCTVIAIENIEIFRFWVA